MSHRLSWSWVAHGRLMELSDFIAQRSHVAATAMVEIILDALVVLEEHPEAGPVWIEAVDSGIRRFVVDSYVIFYEIDSDAQIVKIHTVQHAKELSPELDSFPR